MTAIVYADVSGAALSWSQRAAVFEYLLNDVATDVGADLKQEIVDAIECQGWDVGALPGRMIRELIARAVVLVSNYRGLAVSAGQSDPDYLYLADALQELLAMLRRVEELRAQAPPAPERTGG
jgi:hypothetical protein